MTSTVLDHLLRPNLRSFDPYEPGTSVLELQRRGFPKPVQLSKNENPLGTSPRVIAALREITTLSDYDDDGHHTLRERLAATVDLTADNVILGHGSNELLVLINQTFVEPGDEVIVAAPTFSLFGKNAVVAGGAVVAVPLRDGVHDLDAMLAVVTARTKLLFVCEPNNPTGTSVGADRLTAFARALPERVLLVIDQAYREYMAPGGIDGVEILRARPSTIVLRTASKIYGLAAVRFGYAFTDVKIARALDAVRLPFNVARPAAIAIDAALDDTDFLARSRATNLAGKIQLGAAFVRLGLHCFPSDANFFAVAVPMGADRAYRVLLEHGIIVRSGDRLGMPGRLRITIGTESENAACIAALERLCLESRHVTCSR